MVVGGVFINNAAAAAAGGGGGVFPFVLFFLSFFGIFIRVGVSVNI